MDCVDARIAKIEGRRRRELWRLRGMSMGVLILSFLVDLIDNLTNFLNFVQPIWIMTIIGVAVNLLGITFEYFVRWRQPLVEGPSERLAEIREALALVYAATANHEAAKSEPYYTNSAALAQEESRLRAIAAKLESRLTYDESTMGSPAPVSRAPAAARSEP